MEEERDLLLRVLIEMVETDEDTNFVLNRLASLPELQDRFRAEFRFRTGRGIYEIENHR
jgi:hypothetical protein